MSMANVDLENCDSCGHLIARGRLTCNNCGASAPKPELVGNYNFYQTIIPSSRNYLISVKCTLERIFDRAIIIDRFFTGNDVIGEVHISNFMTFFNELTSGQNNRGVSGYKGWLDALQLYRVDIVIDKDTIIHRFIGVLNGTIRVCEINSLARGYVDDLIAIEEAKEKELKRLEAKREVELKEEKLKTCMDTASELLHEIEKEEEIFKKLNFIQRKYSSSGGFIIELKNSLSGVEKEIKLLKERILYLKNKYGLWEKKDEKA